jgi:uncharacterized protein YqgV (UPF0045/DUF77 family)
MDKVIINAAIQLVPTKTSKNKIEIIDNAIALIQSSGLKFQVCPFETVVEGTYEDVFNLINTIRKNTLKSDCDELLLNIKIHAANNNLFIADKLEKYS